MMTPVQYKLTLAALIIASILGPILACYVVIDWLIGVQRLTVQYWFTDGLVISLVFNLFATPIALFAASRDRLLTYFAIASVCISGAAGAAYWLFTVALIGV
jgi:hypothetical protein